MEGAGTEPALPLRREIRIVSPMISMKRKLVVMAICSAIVLLIAALNFHTHFTLALATTITCAALLFLALITVPCFPSEDPNEGPAIAAILDAGLRGIEADSKVFECMLPPDLAKETVLCIWGVCGTKHQPALQGFLLFEGVWCILVGVGVFFGGSGSQHGFEVDNAVWAMAGIFVVIILWRLYRTIAILFRRCMYLSRVKNGMDVLLYNHRGTIRAWFCEYMSPSAFEYISAGGAERLPHLQVSVREAPRGQALLRVVRTERHGIDRWLQALEWPCCDFADRNLVYELSIPAGRKHELTQWLQRQHVCRATELANLRAAA